MDPRVEPAFRAIGQAMGFNSSAVNNFAGLLTLLWEDEQERVEKAERTHA